MDKNKCNKCGRPIQYATEPNCNYCDACMSEYCGCKLGRIKETEPTCDSTAVIPSITVESAEGITNLANCLVHVNDINTTFYVDDKHRVMITWAGPVNIPGYDMENNPNGYRDQIVTDIEKGIAVIYDKKGKGFTFGIYQSLDADGSVTQAVNNKLDEMAANGTLEEIISDYIGEPIFGFDTVADMKASTTLQAGDMARTLGFYSVNDGGGALYKITDTGTADEGSIIAIGSTLKAHLILTGDIKPELFGAYGDGAHNDSAAFNLCLNYTLSLQSVLDNEIVGREIKLTKDYLIDKLSIPQNMQVVRIIGEKARIRTGGFTFNASTGWKVLIKGITFYESENPINFDYRNIEYGRYEIIDCIFHKCTGTAIAIKRRSCQSLIEGCTFRYCEKSVYYEDNDMAIFRNNWLECNSTHPWGNNHYDVEQYAPNEGTLIAENNMFIPGYQQTGLNPCWIKVGNNAIIKNNRFSGENVTIHPIIIFYDKVASFNINSTLYPIVNILDNPIMAGATSILVDGSARGVINICNNCGWANLRDALRCASAAAKTALASLDYDLLTINIRNNGGRTFNFSNARGTNIPASFAPTVDVELQRFIKNSEKYQGEYNYELKSSVENNILNIEYCTTDLKKVGTIAISGTVNKNPGGSDYYEPFIALLTIERYYDTELRYRAHTHIVTKNNQNIVFNTLLNGQAYITALPSGENVKFTISGNGTARPTFESVEMLTLCPINNKLSN